MISHKYPTLIVLSSYHDNLLRSHIENHAKSHMTLTPVNFTQLDMVIHQSYFFD